MKIAEALVERAHLLKRYNELRARITSSLVVDEGEETLEDTEALWKEARTVSERMRALTEVVNIANQTAPVQYPGARTITLMQAVALRDDLDRELVLCREVVTHSQVESRSRRGYYEPRTKDQIKQVSTVDRKAWQKRHDDLAQVREKLDLAIQAANWNHDLVQDSVQDQVEGD